jgi:hypothetical protein
LIGRTPLYLPLSLPLSLRSFPHKLKSTVSIFLFCVLIKLIKYLHILLDVPAALSALYGILYTSLHLMCSCVHVSCVSYVSCVMSHVSCLMSLASHVICVFLHICVSVSTRTYLLDCVHSLLDSNTLNSSLHSNSTHPLIHSSTRTRPLIRSSTHPLIHSSTHPLTHPLELHSYLLILELISGVYDLTY